MLKEVDLGTSKELKDLGVGFYCQKFGSTYMYNINGNEVGYWV